MAEPKTKATEASVDQFLAAIDEARRAECVTVSKLMQKATGAKPKLWGTAIVGFGSYRYTYESGREGDWPLVAYSPRKAALTLYIMPGFAQYDGLMKKLGKHKTGKSCLYLNKLADVDLKVLGELIRNSVEHMRKKYPSK